MFRTQEYLDQTFAVLNSQINVYRFYILVIVSLEHTQSDANALINMKVYV